AYEALSDEHKAVLDESVDEAIQHYLDNYAALIERWESVLAEKGVQKVTIPEAELAKFREVAAGPVRAAWLSDMSAQGPPAQELLDLVNSTLEKKRMSN
ncbi:MAG: C4-dicarboxylate ABC transporter substrate-binding protein, partial [Alphaproteobacteria bacterium]|nr:C4-dicarboxylate ABC transporter substrate-binding protein [Alphaproteobacteria bacterium]